MTDFQPLGCGFGRTNAPPAVEAESEPTETATMAKKEETTDKILRLIGEAGGELAGADLRDQLGADENERRMAIASLRKAGRISSSGAPRSVVYTIEDGTTVAQPGHRIPNATKPAKKAAKKAGKAKVEKLAKQLQVVIDKSTPPPAPPVTLQVAIEAAVVVEDLQPIARQYLRRVLALALSRPGDIHDIDRQALAAVAAGC